MQKIDDCKEIRLALTRAGIVTCPEKCLQTFRLVVTAQYIYHSNGRRERISSSEAMIYQWTSLGLGLMIKKDNVPRPYITHAYNYLSRLDSNGLKIVPHIYLSPVHPVSTGKRTTAQPVMI
jgi:hypothetical protein